MEYQISLFDPKFEAISEEKSNIKLLSWNIQNPSMERARVQIEWLAKVNADIIVLTEVKDSAGFNMIRAQLECNGYKLVYNPCDSYFTVIALRAIDYREFKIDLLPEKERVAFIEINVFGESVGLMGTYVPTNSRDMEKQLLKKKFQDGLILEVQRLISSKENVNIIVTGDFNIIHPGHIPIYPEFDRWLYFYNFFVMNDFVDIYKYLNSNKREYSWEGQGQKQCLDYIFMSTEISKYVTYCEYDHFPRFNKLSDHSAIITKLERKV